MRQLENIISRAMVVSDGNVLNVENLRGLISESKSPPEDNGVVHNIRIISDGGEFKTIDDIEQEAIQLALDHFNYNVTQASKALGMAKSTFYRKMQS